MKILVTGGTGYIGSHTVVELLNSGFKVIVLDNLSNSNIEVLNGIESITGVRPEFHQVDITDKISLKKVFEYNGDISSVIHFAALKAVGESVIDPMLYYRNNILGFINLLDVMIGSNVLNIVFSSSCTVYGQAEELPVTELSPVKEAESPYGYTKQCGERFLNDLSAATKLKSIALRYFNPIGAHDSALIGELPIGVPNNLVPYITQTAAGEREILTVNGNDYPTPDGTNIRDYIHVVDIAKAHVIAVQRLIDNATVENPEIFNLGTGRGNSVMEIINVFEKVTERKLNYKIGPRRAGDVISIYSDTKKANEILGWRAERDLENMLLTAWNWQKRISNVKN
ncbi:MAG: UDP-glucose 4-epimerase GalE [Ignavibacteriaceae bacterium]|jgi:UDP-glucose 4-epimerase|nr:MAG: UDP-glucose 4-epimerase GalE [Chlorobiota bacterium]KXK06124.1 MAG: UDP-glucose 4-epimerase [Chlorobi bacterium OLB4]MBV6398553.1 UDP-glucose 4-epimerase [Ignavibacteria bacterium]MCC6885787.1 UDP-glucose 4-epimerase GalE [Ignavibacteriales bacterium]MCE7953018.1 UDP-glucose 4-epimerase GalE [Chlorobi bacterium CHB7]MDL1887144.1 UDP-glucose 4-epimerase GalE [Ignavibacteria bacterium CHB1]MEB2329199.1 UDP-glucose 4-epimerase GalE [Ignavibacteriaceae bacterium]OQY78037.1 MAG: UDP-gluco